MHRSLLVYLLLAAIPAAAQFSGRLSGTVLDSSGAPVANAAVGLYIPGGDKPILSTKTATDGSWRFLSVRPTEYDITIDAPGFARSSVRGLAVDPARETDLPPLTLQVSAVNQTLDVTADIETESTETSDTMSVEQVRKLPTLDRDPLALIQTLPGVVFNGNTATTIDGLRTSYSNMTLDGINIQDNYIRDNALDFTPNRVLLGQIRQFTLVTANGNAAAPGGATQLAFETPSGTNTLHGEASWTNRNNYFAANDWFNNQSGVALSRLNQNQGAVSVGGPIRKDRLFFFADYELVRIHQQTPQESTILTDNARAGVFTYVDTGNVVRQTNLLTLRGIQIDPYIQGLLKVVPAGSAINTFSTGDSTPTLSRNTAGYRFNQRSNETRDNITARGDYNLSTKNVFSTTFMWNRDNTDVPDPGYSVTPPTTNPNHSYFLSASWRWTPLATMTNELRGGFNLAPGDFLTNQKFGAFIVTGTLFTDPLSEALAQGRATNTWSVSDNAAWQHGRHYILFGTHVQQVRVHAYDNAGIIPTYNLFMGTGQPALTRTNLPGIRNSDLATANALLATLGGYVDGYDQTFNVTTSTSGYVNGAGNVRDFRLGETDFYVQDNWKIRPRLTASIGLRWDLPGVADEAHSLELQPTIVNNNPIQTLLSNASLNFTGRSVGRPWYARNWKDFAPNVGLAWDVTGNGKTSVRAAYSISYVNDQAIVAPESILEGNSGLIGISSDSGLSGRISSGLPAVAPPLYKIPITESENYASNSLNTIGLLDPNLKTPYVQQWSLAIQHEILHTVFEARYAGNHLVHGYRAFDYNQVDITSNGFLPDFLRAQNNGLLALNRPNGVFNPAYNAAIPGSQPLPVFAQIASGGSLNTSLVRNLIQTGEIGRLAADYQENGLNGSINFFKNPYALGANILNNYSTSSYHSLQLVARHRSRGGLDFSGSYSFSKVLSDTAGDSQSRIEQFLDINNPKLERARATFDLRHSIKGTAYYDLPFGRDHRLHSRALDALIGGWTVGSILSWQSGAPFSILSDVGTLNRADNFRSYYNTANTALTIDQLNSVVHFQMTGNGPLIVAPSAINPADGTGVTGLGVGIPAAFKGQVFFNPSAGTLGVLQRRLFSGPWSFDLDASVQKVIRITERQSLEMRMEGVNILNHPTFFTGDQDINSTTFGVVSSMLNSPRLMQFGLRYKF